MVKKLRWLGILTLVFALTLVLPGQTLAAESNRSPEFQRVIVMFYDSVDPVPASAELAVEHGLTLGHVYQSAIKGFSCAVPAGRLAALKADPRVMLVEPDLIAHTTEQVVPTGVDRIEADLNNTADIDGQDDQRVDVDIAIIDTGIDIDHPELNVVGGRHFYSYYGFIQYEDDNYDDDEGHGTHVAGIAAALDNNYGVVGVAPGARLWAVKVLDASGSGYLSDIAAGINYVTEHADEIEVANMSLAWEGNSTAIRSAISASISAGVVYVVAAGNDSQDIYGSDGIPYTNDDIQPAAYAEVATISAMADYDGIPGSIIGFPDDSFASFSNYSGYDYLVNPVHSPGLGIDLIMPGVYIYSTYKNGGYATMSGTSMASPHAAGLAALYIAEHGRATSMLSVMAVRQALVDAGMPQSDNQNGLTHLNDPDNNEEPIGWAESSGAPSNNPPVAVDDEAIVEEDSTENIINVLANDSDPDGDPLSITSVTDPPHGEAIFTTTSVTYTPNANYYGTDYFSYTISDGNGGTDNAMVNVTVDPVNDAPVANDDSATTQKDTAIIISVLTNDTDVESDTLVVTDVVTQPSNGTTTINTDQTITYNPNAGWSGTDSFSYIISDGNGGTDSAMVTITVEEINNAPVANGDSATTQEDTAVTISVLANDTDAEGDTIVVTDVVTQPSNGTTTINADQTITYNPNADWSGTDSFTYTANDGKLDSNIATVTVTVDPVNDAPVANDDSATTQEDTAVTISVLANDTDVEGDTIVVTDVVTQPYNGTTTINTDQTITYNPNAGWSGTDSFTYAISDGNGGADSATVTIIVNASTSETIVSVDSINYDMVGGRYSNRHLLITVSFIDNLGYAVAGASVSIDVTDGTTVYTFTGTTASDGMVTFKLTNAPSGTYTTTVTSIIADGLTWDGVTPANSYTK